MVKEGKSRVWYEIVSFIVTDAWTQRQKQGRLAVVFLCICAPPLWLIPEYLWLNALKIKNCLSEASFFNLAESHEYYGLKAITGAAFSWLRSFGRAKEWTGAWGRAPFKNNVFQTEVLFTLLAERYEQRSVMITSNLPFSKWEKIFKDPMMTAGLKSPGYPIRQLGLVSTNQSIADSVSKVDRFSPVSIQFRE